MSKNSFGPFQYDVALSFAGEDRDFAKFIAESLSPEFGVFYDEFEKATLWGEDLSETLPIKYVSSRYCVILQSDEYLEKLWTTLERQAMVHEFLRRRGKDYLLPIIVRDCAKSIPGVSGLTGYLRVHAANEWKGAVELLKQKLRQP